MIGFGEGSKEAFDVRAVVAELFATMGKNIGDSVGCLFPGNDPFAMGIHGACRFWCPHDDFDLSEAFGPFLLMNDVISTGEDMIEVDWSASEEVVPFGRWEFGTASWVREWGLCCLRVTRDVFEDSKSLSEFGGKIRRIKLVTLDPR
jgi:hypothetical protein